MLISVRMLMRCLRKSELDRRHMAEAALAMRDVMSREEEPSFVIKDPRYVKESINTTSLLHIFNGRWLVGLGVIAMSFVFGQLICIPTRLASSCKIVRASCSTVYSSLYNIFRDVASSCVLAMACPRTAES